MQSESVYTRGRTECPDPHYWHAADVESTEVEVTELVAGLVRGLQPDLVVETGAAFGQTAHAIGAVLRDNGHGRLVSLEVDGQRCVLARQRCEGLPVEVVEQSSLGWTPNDKIDFMWLDSLPHLRAQEIRRYAPHASDRCVIGVHDTHSHADPICTDLQTLADEGLITAPLYLPTPRGVCFTRFVQEV